MFSHEQYVILQLEKKKTPWRSLLCSLKIELFLVLKVTNHATILEQVQEHKK